MKALTEIPLEGGATILVETDVPREAGGLVQVSKSEGGQVVVKATKSFNDALLQIKPVASAIMNTLKEINSPDEVEVEFGFKLNAEANVVLSSTAVEGHFQVTLKWKKPGGSASA